MDDPEFKRCLTNYFVGLDKANTELLVTLKEELLEWGEPCPLFFAKKQQWICQQVSIGGSSHQR